MSNRDTTAARAFHDATKYTLVGDEWADDDSDIMMGTPPNLGPAIGEQDRAIEPFPYKVYTSLDPLALPTEFAPLPVPALAALAARGDEGTAQPDRDILARICLRSNGILKVEHRPNGRSVEYRAAGGTGARYHLELYLVTGDLPDLDAGVYQYSAQDHSLRQLRSGDYRAALAEATGAEPSIVAAPAVMVVTSTFWRNAWRYQERAYRHVYWDLGTTLANVLAVASAAEVSSKLVMGFVDAQVNRLLDVDGERESAVALVALGNSGSPATASPVIDTLSLPTRPISAREIEFPGIIAMHRASSLTSSAEVAEWRAHPLRRTLPESGPGSISLQPLAAGALPAMTIDDVIQRRRSTRHFDRDVPMPFDALSTLLERSSRGVAMDAVDPLAAPLDDQYLIVNAVEGLDPGSYAVHRERGMLEPLARGTFRSEAAELACRQEYAADGHVNIYYLADLESILGHYGNRGYRLAQLEGSLFAGKLHLAAHALGTDLRLGAVGSTSVDDAVTRFFSPHAAGKSFMFVLVFGKRRRRKA